MARIMKVSLSGRTPRRWRIVKRRLLRSYCTTPRSARFCPHERTPYSSNGKPMATSLYDLSVPTFLQTVSAVAGFLDRAAAHCAETGADPDDFVDARLIDDMAPFHFQIECVAHHSVWGLEAVKSGAFAPPALLGPVPFADLRAMIARAEAALKAFIPHEVNGWSGKN